VPKQSSTVSAAIITDNAAKVLTILSSDNLP